MQATGLMLAHCVDRVAFANQHTFLVQTFELRSVSSDLFTTHAVLLIVSCLAFQSAFRIDKMVGAVLSRMFSSTILSNSLLVF